MLGSFADNPFGECFGQGLRRVITGRGVIKQRRLGQNPDHVVIVRRGSHSAVPPGIEAHARYRAHFIFGVEPPGDGVAHHVHSANHFRGNIRIHRIVKRRHKNARRKRPGLVLVVYNLRKPFLVENVSNVAAFDLIEHVPIAIVVVPHIFVPQLHHWSEFVRRVHILAVPVGHNVQSIGINHRTQNKNHIGANSLHLGGFFGQDAIGDLGSVLRASHFRRM